MLFFVEGREKQSLTPLTVRAAMLAPEMLMAAIIVFEVSVAKWAL